MTNYLSLQETADIRNDIRDLVLNMTCTIERVALGAADPNGHKAETWANNLVNIPCHYWQEQDTEIVNLTPAVVTRERIQLAANTDVNNRDRVTQVTGVDGVQVAGKLLITQVLKRVFDVVLDVKAIA